MSFTVVTGDDGSYRFTNLLDGTYTLSASPVDGFTSGRQTQGQPVLGTVTDTRFVGLNLNGDVQARGYNFGQIPVATSSSSISGRVYIDLNRDGVLNNDEPGLRQVEIRLTGPVTRSVFTGENGFYEFRDLPAGSYTIQQIQPDPYDNGQVTVGSLGGTALPNGFASIVVDGQNQGTGYNFGELVRPRPSRNSIGGVVYLDVNNNGIREPQERVLPNVQIRLEGPVSSITVTADNGTYVFTDLPDGIYNIIQVHPADFLDGMDTIGTPASGIALNDRFQGVVLENNMIAIDYNFGERGLLNPTKAHLLASTPPADEIIRRHMQGIPRFAMSAGIQESYFANNVHFQYDTSNDGTVTPLDALIVLTSVAQMAKAPEVAIRNHGAGSGFYVDVNGDGRVEPLDALLVLNHLSQKYRRHSGEGESLVSAIEATGVNVHFDIDLQAIYTVSAEKQRKEIFDDDAFIGPVAFRNMTNLDGAFDYSPHPVNIALNDEALLATIEEEMDDKARELELSLDWLDGEVDGKDSAT